MSLGRTPIFSLQVRQGLDRGPWRQQDRLGAGAQGRNIQQVGVCGLSENRRCIADRTKVDAADAHGLQQRGTELELDPLDVPAQRRQELFEVMVLLRRHLGWLALLEADAQDFTVGRPGADRGQGQRCRQKMAPIQRHARPPGAPRARPLV